MVLNQSLNEFSKFLNKYFKRKNNVYHIFLKNIKNIFPNK